MQMRMIVNTVSTYSGIGGQTPITPAFIAEKGIGELGWAEKSKAPGSILDAGA